MKRLFLVLSRVLLKYRTQYTAHSTALFNRMHKFSNISSLDLRASFAPVFCLFGWLFGCVVLIQVVKVSNLYSNAIAFQMK